MDPDEVHLVGLEVVLLGDGLQGHEDTGHDGGVELEFAFHPLDVIFFQFGVRTAVVIRGTAKSSHNIAI